MLYPALIVILKIEKFEISLNTEQAQRKRGPFCLRYLDTTDFACLDFVNESIDLSWVLPPCDRHWFGLRGTLVRRTTTKLRRLDPRGFASSGNTFC
jgi:hypothetical protein